MTSTHVTTCPLDCPDTCALQVTTERGRVTAVGPAPNGHPVMNGFICSKVARFGERVYHDDRLRYPMRRVGPKGAGIDAYERIGWDDALAEINERFTAIAKAWGAEAIVPYNYGGSNGSLSDGYVDDMYFARLGASRIRKTICAVPTGEVALGMYGKMAGVAFQDYPAAQAILVWGANPKASSIHFVPFLREAKRNGAFIAVVDPRRNFSAREIDVHLPVRPGTDLPVALAMINWWREQGRLDREFLAQHTRNADVLLDAAKAWTIDAAAREADVPAADLQLVAERFAAASPAVVRCGWGIERNRNGGQAVAAVLAMPALLGKFGVRGGGYTLSNRAPFTWRHTETPPPEWTTRELNMTELGRLLREPPDPPIKALFVYNCNPVATVPDQRAVIEGLSREDLFTVVYEQVATDTVPYADIILPATTFLEHHDLRVGYGSYVVGGVTPAIDAVGEARPNHDVFAALGRGLGWTDPPFSWQPDEHLSRVAAQLRVAGEAADVDRLAAGRMQQVSEEGPVQFEDVQPLTADGVVDLAPSTLGRDPYAFVAPEDQTYPLQMISPATSKLVSSTFGEFNLAELCITLHPDDARARSVDDGDLVRVFNDLGEVHCRARVSPRIRRGVAAMPKGAWRKSSRNGLTSTALCPAHVQVVGGGACYNDAWVDVARLE